MTGREKYNKYCEMCDRIPAIHDNYKKALESYNAIILSDIFIAVGEEETERFFVDVEYKTPVHGYIRKYGLYDMSRYY